MTSNLPKRAILASKCNDARGLLFRYFFEPAKEHQRLLIHQWLAKPHVAKWFYGDGLESTLNHLEEFFKGSPFFHYWIGYDGIRPFAFLITTHIDKPNDSLSQFCEKEGKAITLDLLIGEEEYLGKGLAHLLIEEFLATQFADVSEVLIDPDKTHTHAIHVYEKVGFKILQEFIPTWSPHPHLMMHLDMNKLLKNMCHIERFDSIPKDYEAILFKGISEEALKKRQMDLITTSSLFVKDQDKVIGGISFASVYGALHIDSLWVLEKFRHQGLGAYLVKEAEKLARAQNLLFATVNTMDFEALPFYQKLGYSIEFTREGYRGNSKMFLLRKSLT